MSVQTKLAGVGIEGLVEAYQTSLEHRVRQGDWNLACRDEQLTHWLERLLREDRAQETHLSLGLDSLSVMEASLQAASGLEELAKAFEVLEVAAINLFLCPWRKEFRAVKTFSGVFTHCVKAALTWEQATQLFGLLGYQASGEELKLLAPPPEAELLIRRAVAFFAARCECHVLLSVPRPPGGVGGWELALVKERQRGHDLQAATEGAMRRADWEEGAGGPTDPELDLYTDEEPRETDHSPIRGGHGSSAPTRGEGLCISTLSCQLSRSTPPEHRRFSPETSGLGGADCTTRSGRGGGLSPPLDARMCSRAHGTCVYVSSPTASPTSPNPIGGGASLLWAGPLRDQASPPHPGERNKAPPSRTHEDPAHLSVGHEGLVEEALATPMAFHKCCRAPLPPPQLACLSCRAFHTRECVWGGTCLREHAARSLGLCSFREGCTHPPHVLCRHCGAEFCKECWYWSPLNCSCGQLFDQSSPV